MKKDPCIGSIVHQRHIMMIFKVHILFLLVYNFSIFHPFRLLRPPRIINCLGNFHPTLLLGPPQWFFLAGQRCNKIEQKKLDLLYLSQKRMEHSISHIIPSILF